MIRHLLLHRITHLVALATTLAFCLMQTGCGKGGGAAQDEIIRVSRQSSSGTYEFFREHVLNKKDFKLGSRDMNGSKEVVELVANTPGAIGYSGMGYNEPGKVMMLPVAAKKGEAAVAPTVENALSKKYPIARSLLLYTLGEPQGEVKKFIDWTLSDAGQKLVQSTGYVPLPQDKHVAAGTAAAPDPGAAKATIQVKGSDTMVNLAQAWAEEYKKVAPNVDVEVSGGGSGQGIAALIKGTIEICTASRNMKPEEIEQAKKNTGKEPKEIVVGYDALAIYVHKNNPLQSISIEELAAIFAEGGTITKWSQLTAPAK